MNKIILFIFLFSSTIAFGQQTDARKKHEIKLNGLNSVLGNLELNYEYLINPNSGIGFYGNVNVDNNRIYPYNYMFGGYYRLYIGKFDASGFFVEMGLSAVNEQNTIYVAPIPPETIETFKEVDDFGAGPSIAMGGKFLFNNSIVFEFFGGVGRNFSSDDYISTVYPRIGISIGKRF